MNILLLEVAHPMFLPWSPTIVVCRLSSAFLGLFSVRGCSCLPACGLGMAYRPLPCFFLFFLLLTRGTAGAATDYLPTFLLSSLSLVIILPAQQQPFSWFPAACNCILKLNQTGSLANMHWITRKWAIFVFLWMLGQKPGRAL